MSELSSRLRMGFVWMLLAITVGDLGCGYGSPRVDYGSIGLVDVSGTVTLDGKPLVNAQVKFDDQDGTCCEAMTNQEGRYRLKFDSRTYGTTLGLKTVRIEAGNMAGENTSSSEDDPDVSLSITSESAMKIPATYNKNSILKKQVTAAESNVDFHLNSQGTFSAGAL